MESVDKASRKPPGLGWLDRQRWLLEVLEEAIENARAESQAKTGRGRDNASRLEWTKTLHRLLETYEYQLEAIKRHLYGTYEIGEPGEKQDRLIEFERKFNTFVAKPWKADDLKLRCGDCGAISEDVHQHHFRNEDLQLCDQCNQKRQASQRSS